MSFDKDTNTITLDDNSDFLVDSGLFFINMLRQTSQEKNAPSALVKDWEIIEKWLECQNKEITSIEEEKVGKAWKAYLAIGLAPSFKLQPAFDHYSKQYKDSGYSYKDEKASTEVMDVFDRLLSTDDELSVKRKHDLDEEKKKLEAVFKKLPKKRLTLKQKISTFSRNARILVAVSIAWFVWVVFRTSDDWEILGIYLDNWDDDMFFANIAIPIIVVWLGLKTYKWIIDAKE